MSINGLYDSEVGDKLARKSMQCFKQPVEKKIHFCACGGMLPQKPKWRNGVPVCDGCAEIISKKLREAHRERVVEYKTVCETCGKHFPFHQIVIRNKKKYCKACGAKQSTTWAYTFECTKCGKVVPRRRMVRRNGQYFCRTCGEKLPKGTRAGHEHAFKCSMCGKDGNRKVFRQKAHKLYCNKCFVHAK